MNAGTLDLQGSSTDCLPLVSSLLKRRASPSFDCIDDRRMKKVKDGNQADVEVQLVEVLAEDLQCACCSELVYKPVLVVPCQHFFCGR